MTGPILVIVEGEPQGKGRPRTVVRGSFAQHYTPEKTRNYEQAIADEGRRAMAKHPPLECACAIELSIVMAVPASWSKAKREAALAGELMPTKKPDIDNVVKAVCDGLNGIVFVDDVQVVDLIARKRYGPTPHIEARIYALGSDHGRGWMVKALLQMARAFGWRGE